MPFTEANFENAILEIFRDLLGYETLYGPDVVRDFAEPLCLEMLDEALVRLNPSLPRAAIDEASRPHGVTRTLRSRRRTVSVYVEEECA